MPHRSYARHKHGPAQGRDPHEYTLAHAGRQVRIGPVSFWVVVGTLVIMGAWSITTATYFAFRDDVLTRLIARQADMQFAYEDRIAELRARVDRVSSRQLLDQEQFEQRLEQIVRRQAVLESRSSALGTLPDMTPTGSIPPAARPLPSDAGPLKPSPINDTVIFIAPPERDAQLESRTPATTMIGATTTGGIGGALARLGASLARVEARQIASLDLLEDMFDTRARSIRGVLADLGLEQLARGKTGNLAAASATATGGPFVPAKPKPDAGSFQHQLYRISLSRVQVDELSRVLGTVPVRRPVDGPASTTSGFGVRADPFTNTPAMHTGLDFRAASGDPVRATAAGTVTNASWTGGYGQMVEINHGNGLVTRYGHLSAILVKVGDKVKVGQIVGEVGSTGRSTGPHLHYETRVSGDAVDPQKFLRAGIRLGSIN